MTDSQFANVNGSIAIISVPVESKPHNNDGKEFYWVAINRASATAYLIRPFAMPTISPTPQLLIGFPTTKEAADAENFLLNASPEDVAAQLAVWPMREDLKIVFPASPEPPGITTSFNEDSERLADDEGGQA